MERDAESSYRAIAMTKACSVLQVYHESIFDLLEQARKPQAVGPRPALHLKEDTQGRVFVAGLVQV